MRSFSTRGLIAALATPGEQAGPWPLSPAQEGLWFMQRLAPLSTAYHLARVFHLRGQAHISALEQALNAVRARQAALRTRFAERDGKPFQIVDAPADVPLPLTDLSSLHADAREAALAEALAREAQQPFDLSTEGAIRLRVFVMSTQWTVLSVVAHHLVSDGTSTGIFTRELAHAYGRIVHDEAVPELPELTWQYADFVAWQRNMLASENARADMAWWTTYIGSSHASFDLPADFTRAPTQERLARTHTFTLTEATTNTLRSRCKAERCTLFAVLMAAWQLVLSRHAGSDDFCIGVPTSGRRVEESEDLIGLFVDTQVYRARIQPAMSGRALLQAVRNDTRAALDHGSVTLAALVDALGVRREAGRHPLFQTLFNVQGAAASGKLQLAGLEVDIVDTESQAAKFDLSLDIRVSADAVTCTARYDGTLYRAETIARLGRHYEAMLTGLCQKPERPVSEIAFIDEEELGRLSHWSTHIAEFGEAEPVHRLFERYATKTPDAAALLFGDEALTYRELDRRANRLAHRLVKLGVGPEVKVGIGLERSVEMVAGLLAILKAGGAYVPLDPDYPPERLAYMIGDSGVALLLTQRTVRERLQKHLPPGDACTLLELDALDTSGESPLRPDVRIHAENLAYVIYTSGSTGRPKGAANRHGALFNRLAWMQAAYRLDATHTVLQKTPFSFDVSVWEFFWPLMTGACLAVAGPGDHRDPARLVELIDRFKVTTLHFVPPMLQAFIASFAGDSAVCASLRQIICSGEALPATLQDRALQRLPHVQLHNLYGPTEAAIDVTHWTCHVGDPVVPIGRPIANVSTHVLDQSMNRLPVGVAGELYLGGAGLARGYLDRPGLTAERFVPDPFKEGERLYRTGDLARWREDGALDYLGRLDHQVKIRGFRIEPGEIEAALQTLPGVDEAVVVAQDGPGGKRLVAYVTAQAGHALRREALAARLHDVLPEYMVPSAWVELERLPLSPNGKVDRRALPEPAQTERLWEAPQGEVETVLARVWQEVLGVERVGRGDNFFELGGDSILSLLIVERVRLAGWKVTPRQLFERQTVVQLAAVAEPVVATHAVIQDTAAANAFLPMQAWFLDLPMTHRHHWNQAVLLKSLEPLDAALLENTLQALVQHHDALRMRVTQDTEGRWSLSGSEPASAALLWVRDAATPADIPTLCDEAQRSLDLTHGPLLRALAINVADGSSRLLFAIHHLAVDGVSWRILLADLRTIHGQLRAGEPVVLPPKTSSCAQWATRLADHASSTALRGQLNYWLDMARTPAGLPRDFPDGVNTVAHRLQATLTLDRLWTQRLLQEAPAAYRTHVNDLLLTALGRALCEWTGSERIRIDLEGHGREDLFDDIDLSRTIGWFTSLYPVSLDPQGDVGAALGRVKEALRQVPDRGLGFGVLKYLGDDADRQALGGIESSQVVFNYLGQFDQSFDATSTWQPASESVGYSQDEGTPLPHDLSVSGKVLDGTLMLSVGYSGKRYRASTVERLIDAVRVELERVIEHCTSGKSGATPSDFELISLNQDELDRLPLTFRNVADIYPLSPMQSGMLFHTLYAPGSSVYLNQLRADIDGLDVARFGAAWAAVTARHDILRTGFVPQGEGWLQWVARSVELPLSHHDLRGRHDLAAALDDLASADLKQGFDVTRAPLQRLSLIRVDTDRYHFVWTHHHVLMDGWSVAQLLGEVLRHYSGQSLPAHGGRYRDYIGWLQKHDAQASAAHWREQVTRIEEPTRLATAVASRYERAGTEGDREYGQHTFELDAASTARLVAFARQERVTVNTLVQAAWALLLQRYTHQPTVTFGATLAGRPAGLAGASQLLGLFINTLPVIAQPHAGKRLDSWLRELQQQGMAAQEHAHTPLYEIQRWAGASAQGLFDTVVVFENYPVDTALKNASPGGLTIDNVRACDETSYPLTLGVMLGETLRLDYRFAHDAFSDEDMAGIAQQTAGLLNAFAGAADRLLAEFDLLDGMQRQALMTMGHTDALTTSAENTLPVHALIETREQQKHDALALVAGNLSLSYGELNARANRLAHRLMREGVGPEVRVGFAVARSVDMIVGMLAVLKAGGAYVPLDPAYPLERLAHMVADSGISLLLTQSHLHGRLPAETGLTRLDLDTLDVSAEPASNPSVTLSDANLAYVIYTSGSTGKPKGVAVAHRALSMHCSAIVSRYGITPEDRQLHFASISFDAAAEQWLAPLISGAAIVLRDDTVWTAQRLAAEIKAQEISILDLPPAYINAFAQETEAGTVSVRTCIVGGEGWSRSGFEAVKKHLNPERIFNAYGPSETVITSTVWSADGASEFDSAYAPIGVPVGERMTYVLDPAMCLVPQGTAGELYVGGAGLARGYLNRAALTAERFVPDPFGRGEGGGRLYRTGDLVRRNSTGELEFLGRIDHQVKLRGFRIELGEIETALLALPGVRDAVATLHDATGSARLVAYVSGQAGTVIDGSTLKTALHDVLPEYMLPSAIVVLDALPLTPNGKVDRHALPAPELLAAEHYEAPQGEVEEAIAGIWSEVLGIEQIGRVGRRDNFFELGGDSIFSLQVQRRISRQLSVEVELAVLFASPTLEAFAAVVSAARTSAAAAGQQQDRLTDDMQSILSELMR
ncbi:amino acid adenylation domain-containing protein/non-ribosomal peptide synthase protein (TIGR01720 family) [Caballeronia udeis]|uniref:Amino acid adenylation domain-containing protein/non-ribosomal peptide synthase protein (TIGR01720 family) n=1 Tax=Caballeronia udeis TaxID=1232866 RepID=A0ABW8MQE7_9BURK